MISDPGGLQVRVPVTIELVNLAPVANPDVVRADSGPVTFQPLANDSDPDGDAIALQSVPDTLTFANGVVGSIQRLGGRQPAASIPATGAGTATFAYSVVDQFGLVSPETTVTVIVNSPPTAPAVDVGDGRRQHRDGRRRRHRSGRRPARADDRRRSRRR